MSVSLFTIACLDMSRTSVGDPDLSDPTVRKTKLFPSHTEQLQNVIFPFSLRPILLYLFALCSVPLPGCRIKSKSFKSPDLLFVSIYESCHLVDHTAHSCYKVSLCFSFCCLFVMWQMSLMTSRCIYRA